mmetsp:Transcript_19041/g.29321  ORF Transcript_19041/g.29321 Transcript_19041/m.29321 type:complete len:277 (+) Transcript_19041:175-1005(+)
MEDMNRLLCEWNNHGVHFFENGEPDKATTMFGGVIRMMEMKVAGEQINMNEMNIQKAASLQLQSTANHALDRPSSTPTRSHCGVIHNRHEDISSTNTISELCYQEAIKIDSSMIETTASAIHSAADNTEMADIVSFFQSAVTLYNCAIVHHIVQLGQRSGASSSSTTSPGSFTYETALELYRMSFDFLLHITCQTTLPASSIPSQIVEQSRVMYMAILNNSAQINFECGNLVIARGCMDHMTLLINATDEDFKGGPDEYFLINSIIFGSTLGAAAA